MDGEIFVNGITCGVGFVLGITSVDKQGRVLIPKEMREKLDIRPDQRVIMGLRGRETVTEPTLTVEEISKKFQGCVQGSKVRLEELKEIWSVRHNDH